MARMTPRERILAAFAHTDADAVPFDIGGMKTTSMNVTAYRNLERCLGLDPEPVQWGNYLSQRTHMREDLCAFLGGDVRRVHILHPASLPAHRLAPVQRDEWGIEWTQEPAGLFYVTDPPLAGACSAADFDAYPWPEPREIFSAPDRIAEAAASLRKSTDCAICLDLPDTVVHVSQNIRGYEQWLVDSASDVPLFENLLDRITEIYCEMVGPVLRAAGDNIDVVVICDDIATQNGALISPRTYRKLIKPRHARVFEAIRANTAAKLVFHSDGAMRWALPDLIEIGMEGFNPVQCSAENMDPVELKRDFGKDIVFWGSIDTQHVLPFGTPDDVRLEVGRMIDALYGDGGFVIGSVHIIQKEVPPENVLAMVETAHVRGGRSDGSRFRLDRPGGLRA